MQEAQIADAIGNWARKAQLPAGWAYATGFLKPEIERDLVEIVNSRYRGDFNFNNLDSAVLCKLHADAESVREQKRVETLVADIGTLVDAKYPDLAHNQRNFDRILALAKNPATTLDSVVADFYWAPQNWDWKSGPKVVDIEALLKRHPRAELEAVYGVEAVSKVLDTVQKRMHKFAEAARPSWKVDPAEVQNAKAEAEQRKHEREPKAIARAMEACESIVKHLSVSNNHAENVRAKSALAQVSVHTDGVFDPYKTLAARESWVKSYIPESERRH